MKFTYNMINFMLVILVLYNHFTLKLILTFKNTKETILV